ncbi:putative transcription factor, mitochondrial [Wickerhamomyces ciferrii]|uniref:Large ribosomal subunit protein mL67 n=1 Tax=Wickerhamomyces ciferrii (strain ATCC 14091 / BCRC 22168 / CBS 111 / JCM 3599 / NBRC 0793 / NRRL Y-1031 F-60-10) TaxID=1206466 RepID=K0KXV2_WICCF|nr:putative transcription factor, mitochondrial [Wickerhamomyces ciferrii]CCH46264.1 putative transcription factor, mitochondrial [Wickerhamomyces ciferrii]
MATKFRGANWLQKNDFAPQIFLFRNLETGQVLYSQLPEFSDYQIKKQFQRPNWENRRPKTRPDIWRIMAVANFPTYESSIKAFESLVHLRTLRDVVTKDVAMKYRPKNEDNHIWYSGQFRPVYTQEAVADLNNVIQHIGSKTTIFWEDEWRKGDSSHWKPELVQHETMNRTGTRIQSALLDELRVKGRELFQKASREENTRKQKREADRARKARRKAAVQAEQTEQPTV